MAQNGIDLHVGVSYTIRTEHTQYYEKKGMILSCLSLRDWLSHIMFVVSDRTAKVRLSGLQLISSKNTLQCTLIVTCIYSHPRLSHLVTKMNADQFINRAHTW